MRQLTIDSARALKAPTWLATSLPDAIAKLEALAPPSEAAEEWRYGLIDEIDLERFSLSERPTLQSLPTSGEAHALLSALGDCAALIRTLDGVVIEIEASSDLESHGVRVSASSKTGRTPDRFGAQLAQVPESFAAMAQVFASDCVWIEAQADAVLDAPIVVIHELSAAPTAQAVFPRTFISLGERAEITVVEMLVSGSDECLVIPVTEIEIAEEADLAYHGIGQLGERSWQLAYQLSTVQRGGIVRSFAAGLGGHYARLYTRARLVADDAAAELSAVYLATGQQVQDFRTFLEHEAPRTKSNLVFKGAVDDQARSVYTGLIHMHKGARRAEASQTNRNLVLSEGAHADSVPNLDIEENDVRCSHASAVGPIDANQRFYLESRGISPQVAERLILLGFFEDLLAKVPAEGCARYLSEVITQRLAPQHRVDGEAS